jgi:hypothetical protein
MIAGFFNKLRLFSLLLQERKSTKRTTTRKKESFIKKETKTGHYFSQFIMILFFVCLLKLF